MSAAESRAGRGRFFLYAGLAALLVVALLGMDVVVLALRNPALAASPHYYMALGDSLSFGYQPDDNFTSGFVDDVYSRLSQANGKSPTVELVNYACAGETTTSMIVGGCPGRIAHHGFYTGSQLQAALDFLKEHPGRVSPITLEIGSNDVLPDWNSVTCAAGANTTFDLATMDSNLTQTILPQLVKVLEAPSGFRPGDLHLINYYNPFAKDCANSAQFVHLVNDHLATDAAQFRIPVVDVYSAFGGDSGMAANICGAKPYTWICDAQFHDVHPTTLGYTVMAGAVEQALGPPGTNPLPGIAPFGRVAPSGVAWRREGRLERTT